MSSSKTTTLSMAEARQRIIAACRTTGASAAVAISLTEATLSAEWHDRPEMGCLHLLDYLDGFAEGRIDGQAQPLIEQPLPAMIGIDARRGIAQLGFDLALPRMVEATHSCGISLFVERNCYTAGEIGYYVRRLAAHGLVAIAWANSHAMLATSAGHKPVYGTNPLAFAAPRGGTRGPLVFDQASSATAFVNLARAAAAGEEIPAGWAIDPAGAATTDPAQAMLGALLPFGGNKGANLALMVEIMAAGLSGGRWSLDAGHFRSGSDCPGTGLTIATLVPQVFAPDFEDRLDQQLERLERLGVHIPGSAAGRPAPREDDTIVIDRQVWAAICVR